MSTQNYYMILKFDSAKIFPYEPESKFNKKKQNSDSFQHSLDTLFWSHVSNPLHVLCGLRPTKTFKQNSYTNQSSISNELINIAKSAKIKFTNVTKQTDAKGIVRNVDEIFTGNKYLASSNVNGNTHFVGMRMKLYVNQKIKAFDNPKSKEVLNKKTELKNIVFAQEEYVLENVITKTPNVSWMRFRHHVTDLVYDSFVSMTKQIINNCFEIEFKTVIEILNKEYYLQNKLVVDFFDKHYRNKPKDNLRIPATYYNIICNGKVSGQFIHQSGYGNLFSYYRELVTRCPEQIVTINGEIVVKVDSEILNHIVRTSCTILDGGVLQISNIVPENEFNLDLLNGHNNVKTEKEYV